MDYIYTITMLDDFELNKYANSVMANDTWTVGWYETYEEAHKAVIENRCDIQDGVYDYAVIEKCYRGLHGLDSEERHFFVYDEREKKFRPCEQPQGLTAVGHWQ